jgi:hypothetical protein
VFTLDRPSESSPDEEPRSGDIDTKTSSTTEKVALPAVLAASAFASLGAGAIHATAAGAHSEAKAASVTFVIIAVLQIGWGVAALLKPHRLVTLAGVLINGGAAIGWVLAKTSGIGFINGLDEVESPGTPDTLAAGLAIASVVGALLVRWSGPCWRSLPGCRGHASPTPSSSASPRW